MKSLKNDPYAYFDLSELDLVNNPDIIHYILLSDDENLMYKLESELAYVKGQIERLERRFVGICENIFDCGYSIRRINKPSHPIEIYDEIKEKERLFEEREVKRKLIKHDVKSYKKRVSHLLYKENK